jgi:hypothetical protein
MHDPAHDPDFSVIFCRGRDYFFTSARWNFFEHLCSKRAWMFPAASAQVGTTN